MNNQQEQIDNWFKDNWIEWKAGEAPAWDVLIIKDIAKAYKSLEELLQADKETAIREVGERIKNLDLEYITGANFDMFENFERDVENAIDEVITTYLAEGR